MSENKRFILGIGGLIALRMALPYRHYMLDFMDRYAFNILLFLLFNILVYRYIVKIMLLRRLYQASIRKIDQHIASLYYILLVGTIGSRKSVNLTAFTQMVEMSKIQKMDDKSYKIEALLGEIIDFTELHTFIHTHFDHNIVHFDQKYRYLVYRFAKKADIPILTLTDIVRFEAYHNVRVLDLLVDYVEIYYYRHFRKANVLSNTTIESVSTGINSIPVKESFFQLYRQNAVAHEKYLTIVEDEKGVVDNARVYARMDKQSVKDNDDGKDIHAMLQRHGSKGTNTTLVVSQSEKDVTANRRRLPNRFVEFLAPSDVYIFNVEISILKWVRHTTLTLESRKYSSKMRSLTRLLKRNAKKPTKRRSIKAQNLQNRYHNYLVVNNGYKRIYTRLTHWINQLSRHLYLIQYMFLHDSEDHLGKKDDEETKISSSFPLTLIYPASITYERYDQYAYYDVYNERNKHASTPLNMIPPFKKRIMSKEEHLNMNYNAINRIYSEVAAQNKPLSPQKTKTSYDAF